KFMIVDPRGSLPSTNRDYGKRSLRDREPLNQSFPEIFGFFCLRPSIPGIERERRRRPTQSQENFSWTAVRMTLARWADASAGNLSALCASNARRVAGAGLEFYLRIPASSVIASEKFQNFSRTLPLRFPESLIALEHPHGQQIELMNILRLLNNCLTIMIRASGFRYSHYRSAPRPLRDHAVERHSFLRGFGRRRAEGA